MNEKEILKLKSQKLLNVAGIFVSVVIGLIAVITQSKDTQTTQTSILLFGLLLFAIAVFFLVSYPINLFKSKVNQLDNNTNSLRTIRKDLNIINDKLNFRRDVENLNIRISTLENLLKIRGKIK